MAVKNIKKAIKYKLYPQYLWYQRMRTRIRAKLISDEKYVMMKYQRKVGELPNLENPTKYNEYVTKIIFSQPSELMIKCADKYEVRAYVEEKAGKHLLNELYGVYYSFKEIERDFDSFPDRFVLKATHGSSWNFICKDKSKVDLSKLKPVINHWLKSNFYYAQREPMYKSLVPKIVCEKYLEDDSGALMDYKVHCFNGEPGYINVIRGRNNNTTLNTYDIEWNYLDVRYSDTFPSDRNKIIEKPALLEKLLEYSRVLSEDFKYVRVDFYMVDGHIYFGELTFTPGNGSYSFSDRDNLLLGSYFKDVVL